MIATASLLNVHSGNLRCRPVRVRLILPRVVVGIIVLENYLLHRLQTYGRRSRRPAPARPALEC